VPSHYPHRSKHTKKGTILPLVSRNSKKKKSRARPRSVQLKELASLLWGNHPQSEKRSCHRGYNRSIIPRRERSLPSSSAFSLSFKLMLTVKKKYIPLPATRHSGHQDMTMTTPGHPLFFPPLFFLSMPPPFGAHLNPTPERG
jgi:hypothetical protein